MTVRITHGVDIESAITCATWLLCWAKAEELHKRMQHREREVLKCTVTQAPKWKPHSLVEDWTRRGWIHHMRPPLLSGVGLSQLPTSWQGYLASHVAASWASTWG